jgi:hypothetical protein
MYLKEGRSLLLKVHKPPIPFVLNTNPIPNPRKPQIEQNQSLFLKESEVENRLKREVDIILALEYFKSIANSGTFKHTPLTYQTMIEKLGREKNQTDGVQYLLHQMKLEGISCSEDLFVSVIKCLSASRVGRASIEDVL